MIDLKKQQMFITSISVMYFKSKEIDKSEFYSKRILNINDNSSDF
jgi:hypothetical protein